MTYLLSRSVAAIQLASASKAEIPPVVYQHAFCQGALEGTDSGLSQASAIHISLDSGCGQWSH